MRSEIVANPFMEQLAVAILGPRAFMRYWGGNCSLPAPESYLTEHMADEAADGDGLGGLMGLHMDSSYPWSWTSQEEADASGQPWPHPTQRIFCNFGLHQM